MNIGKCSEDQRSKGKGRGCIGSQMRPLQDQDSSSFSVRKNEVKSNLIAITGDNSRETNKALKEKEMIVQDCSQAATCDDLRLLASSTTSKLNHHISKDSPFPTYDISSSLSQLQ